MGVDEDLNQGFLSLVQYAWWDSNVQSLDWKLSSLSIRPQVPGLVSLILSHLHGKQFDIVLLFILNFFDEELNHGCLSLVQHT